MVIFVIGLVAGGRYLIQQRLVQQISVTVPKLSPEAMAGAAVFVAQCAGCHGRNAVGSDKGPIAYRSDLSSRSPWRFFIRASRHDGCAAASLALRRDAGAAAGDPGTNRSDRELYSRDPKS